MTVARALFPKAKEPRYAFEVLVRLLPEVSLRFTHDGISVRALDPTKTVLLDLTLYASSLEDYVLEEREVEVGLILTTVKDVLKRIGATEKLEIEVDKERGRFSFYVYPKKGKEVGLVRRFSFPIVEVIKEEVPELAFSFNAQAELKAEAVSDALELIKAVSDWVQIAISPDGVAFRGVGDGGKAAEVVLGPGDEGLLDVAADNTYSSKYSVEQLELLVDKFKSVSKSIRIGISNNKPAVLEFHLGVGELKAVIAPRVD